MLTKGFGSHLPVSHMDSMENDDIISPNMSSMALSLGFQNYLFQRETCSDSVLYVALVLVLR